MSAENPTIAGGLGLNAEEVRVLGCLLEKQLTTPDMYPLTLNSLRLACNQSTNRDPVVDYDDTVLRNALHHLERRGFARLASGRGSRAPKYRHLLAEALPLTRDEHAILCVLLLRGAQTPGELKQRGERMYAFSGLEAVHETLERLAGRELVACVKRRPGQKEERYVQLLEDREPAGVSNGRELERASVSDEAPSAGPSEWLADRTRSAPGGGGSATTADLFEELAGLRERVAGLEQEVGELRAVIGGLAGSEETTVREGLEAEVAASDQSAGEWP